MNSILPKKSSSEYQSKMEEVILVELENHLKVSLLKGQKKIEGVNFQIDFMNEESEIYGEIYVCQFPLKSGHLRKIKSDLLKLLTIEKLSLPKKIEKYIVLTISEKDRSKLDPLTQDLVINHSIEFNLLGKKSWIFNTICIFKFNVLYIVLSDEVSVELARVRENQKDGMSN